MPRIFEELDYCETPLGELVLRRRQEPRLRDAMVYEVKLGEEFLMSSLFTTGERALAGMALAELEGGDLDVVVGGLGLGYTAAAALAEPRVGSLLVIEYLAPVIRWHRQGLVPLGEALTGDGRCRLVSGDFFALATGDGAGFDFDAPGRRFHAVLLDVDHSPRQLLDGASAGFYGDAGLRALERFMHPGGVFAMWSNDPPDDEFLARLSGVFADARAPVVEFPNPYSGQAASCTIYLARRGSQR